jgi:hypothetical protein
VVATPGSLVGPYDSFPQAAAGVRTATGRTERPAHRPDADAVPPPRAVRRRTPHARPRAAKTAASGHFAGAATAAGERLGRAAYRRALRRARPASPRPPGPAALASAAIPGNGRRAMNGDTPPGCEIKSFR